MLLVVVLMDVLVEEGLQGEEGDHLDRQEEGLQDEGEGQEEPPLVEDLVFLVVVALLALVVVALPALVVVLLVLLVLALVVVVLLLLVVALLVLVLVLVLVVLHGVVGLLLVWGLVHS